MNEPDEYTEKPAKPEPPEPTSTKDEIKALGTAYTALASIDYPAQLRALRWLGDRLDAEHRAARRDNYDEEPPF